MSEMLHFHSVDQLRSLSLSELRALWELVPTERQRLYRTAYEREIRLTGAEGSDARELQMAGALLKRYQAAALVPVGERWARAPKRVQQAAERGESTTEPDETAAQPSRPSARIVLVLAALAVTMAILLLSRGGDSDTDSDPAQPSATVSVDVTLTPLALEAQDEVVTGGDAGRAPFYPINLQIALPGEPTPRVWVVQRRAVRASEWNFDPNPDTASYLNGLSVRPVIGIPWSEENAAWFAGLGQGAEFRLQMNTGAILTFTFEEKREVRRSETGIFRQVQPGLVLLLLGETDADGFPTATRTLVTAGYPVEQELGRAGELVGGMALPLDAVTPTAAATLAPTPVPVAGLDVQVVSVTTSGAQITVQLRLYNAGGLPILVEPDDVWLALGYAENPPGPRVPAEGLAAFELLPGQAADVTLIWLWNGEPYGSLGIGEWQFGIEH